MFLILVALVPSLTGLVHPRRDFDTLQYLCGSAYNGKECRRTTAPGTTADVPFLCAGLPMWVIDNISSTLLLPAAAVATLCVAFLLLRATLSGCAFASLN